MPQHFLHLADVPEGTLYQLLDMAQRLKRNRKREQVAEGKSIGLLFFNASLRTRTSMDIAAYELGAHALTLDVGKGVWPLEWQDSVIMDGIAAEHIRDAIPVLSRYFHALGVRVFPRFKNYEEDSTDWAIHRIAELSSIPVINLESAFDHPCQALGDLMTIREHVVIPRKKKFVLTWAYHPRALPMSVPNAALIAAARSGMDVVVARPEGFELDERVMEQARSFCERLGSRLEETSNRTEAFEGAHVIYAKSWASRLIYESVDEEARLREMYRDWIVTMDLMKLTDKAIFMHCLPIRRGVVVEEAVLESPFARHIEQAENRLHVQKALLRWIWGDR